MRSGYIAMIEHDPHRTTKRDFGQRRVLRANRLAIAKPDERRDSPRPVKCHHLGPMRSTAGARNDLPTQRSPGGTVLSSEMPFLASWFCGVNTGREAVTTLVAAACAWVFVRHHSQTFGAARSGQRFIVSLRGSSGGTWAPIVGAARSTGDSRRTLGPRHRPRDRINARAPFRPSSHDAIPGASSCLRPPASLSVEQQGTPGGYRRRRPRSQPEDRSFASRRSSCAWPDRGPYADVANGP